MKVEAEFGSEFQKNFARDSLLIALRSWRNYVNLTHKENTISVYINGDNINNLDFFNWEDNP